MSQLEILEARAWPGARENVDHLNGIESLAMQNPRRKERCRVDRDRQSVLEKGLRG